MLVQVLGIFHAELRVLRGEACPRVPQVDLLQLLGALELDEHDDGVDVALLQPRHRADAHVQEAVLVVGDDLLHRPEQSLKRTFAKFKTMLNSIVS